MFSTGHYIEPSVWDQVKQRVKGTSPLANEINKALLHLKTEALNAYNESRRKSIQLDPEQIRNMIVQLLSRLTLCVYLGRRTLLHKLTLPAMSDKQPDRIIQRC